MKSKHLKQITSSQSPAINIKSFVSPTNKKVQGFDKTTSSQMFSSKVNKLKNKPKVQGLQDQYIHGLQDQIKYLELELKLLQEKDQERHGQIDQLQKFFADGVPINENILAIKNGFNNYKSSNQKKLKELSGQRVERGGLINQLEGKVQKLLVQLGNTQKQNKLVEQGNQNKLYQMIYKQAALKKKLQKEQQELKSVKVEVRKTSQNLDKLTRNKLINNITIIKHQNHKNSKLDQLRQTLWETQAQLQQLQQEHNLLLKSQEQKSFLMTLEEDNLIKRKKIIAFQRDYDNLKSKIKEKEMELQEKLRERIVEINQKNNIKEKVNDVKEDINKQNSMTVETVQQITRNREVQKLKKIVDQNQVLSKHIDHYSVILTTLENNIENLAQRRPQAKSQLQFIQKQLSKLQGRYENQKEREIALCAQLIQIQQQSSDVKTMTTPIQEKSRKKNDQINAYLEEKRRLMQEIKVKQKQLELIFILKGLNFEEAEISKNSNNSIQEQLTSFLKNWQKLQRTP